MGKTGKIDFGSDIILFCQESKINAYSCRLGSFIGLMKNLGYHRPLSYFYVPKDPVPMANLTLMESLLLDVVPINLTHTKEFQLLSYFQKIGQDYLLNWPIDQEVLNLFPHEVDIKVQKLIDLLKGFLSTRTFLFLEGPEKYLDIGQKEALKQALIQEVKVKNKVPVIYSDDVEYWKDIVTKIVVKRPSGPFEFFTSQEFLADYYEHKEGPTWPVFHNFAMFLNGSL